MIPTPGPISIPFSYENLRTTHIKLSHHPAGAKDATPVVLVTLNRPNNHNAFTLDMMRDFEKVYPMFDVDERVKVVVLTGAGKTFCAGADLDIGFPQTQKERPADHRDRYGLFDDIDYDLCSDVLRVHTVVAAWHWPSTGAANRRLLRCKDPLLDWE